jgi:WD40 repeat protein
MLWDAGKGLLLKFYTTAFDYILSVSFHPSGNWVATGNEDRAVLLFDVTK